LWTVFKGRQFHRNTSQDCSQLSMFSEEDDTKMILGAQSREAKEKILCYFANKTVAFNEISVYIQCNTMLKESQIINNVIKPLIEKGEITKNSTVGKQNFKKDLYTIKSENQ